MKQMSVFPGGYNLGQCVEFEPKVDLLEARIALVEKRNQTLTELLEKNTEYLLKEIMLLKAQLGGVKEVKKEKTPENADIDVIIQRLAKSASASSTTDAEPSKTEAAPIKPVFRRSSDVVFKTSEINLWKPYPLSTPTNVDCRLPQRGNATEDTPTEDAHTEQPTTV
jgi:hypothetical protein